MSENAGEIQHVSDTALWVAHYRAKESERPDALFNDPYARLLVGEKGEQIARRMRRTGMFTAWIMAIRTYIIDRYIMTLVKEGVETVLNLGAGLDTRPYRMHLPSTLRWIEVDYPHMIEHKEKLLSREQPKCNLERYSIDLADRVKRQTFFAEICARSKKVLVITEGVIPYLSVDQVGELADDLGACEPIQFWIAEYFSIASYPYFKNPRRLKEMRNAPFKFFPDDWWPFFKAHGWIPREKKFLAEESLELGRKPPMPWWTVIASRFMDKEKAKKFHLFSAYVLYTRSN